MLPVQKIKAAIYLIVFLSISGCKPPAANVRADDYFDDAIFDSVQRATFEYFWTGAEPNSGLARERYHMDDIYPQNDKMVITTGGSGFGVMALLVGMERNYITREQGIERFERILSFLEKADRYHGVWPHWLNGETGKVRPFSKKDDGADLVESSFLMTGLLCVRQYYKEGSDREKNIAARIDKLWKEMDFNWFRNGKNVLYWHWSPNYGWEMNFPVTGYNECLIMYVLGAASPTHSIPAEVYHEGWAGSGKIKDTVNTFGHTLTLSHNGARTYGGPLFWSHYSFVGLDPRGLKDRYADYWQNGKAHTLINREWCVRNPKKFKGYGSDNWGLTASYSMDGYSGHAPGEERDLGVISPTAALSSMPYTPEYSSEAMRHWFLDKKEKIWGPFGFYDAFSDEYSWYPQKYLAIDQGPIVVMMENHRTGLLWDLFMSCPEVMAGLKILGFQSPHLR